MDTLQAAVLSVKLLHLPRWTEARRQIAAAYDHLLADPRIQKPALAGLDHVYHIYAVRVAERNALRDILQRSGVSTGIHYPVPVHMQPAYSSLVPASARFPVAERLSDQLLSLPIYPEMTPHQVGFVAQTLARAVEMCSEEVA
jgi:dTDP-4-amino-4,6-dideoxygalactose transaminase